MRCVFFCTVLISVTTHFITAETTPIVVSKPALQVSTSKLCLGPDEGSQVSFPIFIEEFCAHMQYNPGKEPKVEIKVTWGSKVIGSEVLKRIEKPKNICLEESLCKLCLGIHNVEITERWANICPAANLVCPTVKRVTIAMGCASMGDSDRDYTMSIAHGLTKFGLTIIRSGPLTKDMDTFVSPLSMANTLVSLSFAASGWTRAQIFQALHISGLGLHMANLAESYGAMVSSISHSEAEGEVTSTSLSNLWIVESLYTEVSDLFINNFCSFGEIRKIDFRDSHMALAEMNNYISNLSRNHIPEAIENINNQTVVLFTNVMYLTAEWEIPFDSLFTRTFYDIYGKTFFVKMMGTASMEYFVTVTSKMEIIEVPLKQEFSNFGFFIVRPLLKGMRNTIEVEEELKAIQFQRFMDNRDIQKRTLKLPVFTMYYIQDMTDELKSMGIRDVFDINLANMTTLFNNSRNTSYEGAFIRQGRVEVSQKGFTISAFSGAGVDHRTAQSGKVMHADRPFIFLVFEKSTTTLMFAGRISNPNGWTMDQT